jgi:branched-chain amino acid aminotransferase
MILANYDGAKWSKPEVVSSDSIQIHPGSHVLHYSSTCFEGLKAFKHADGSVKIFRPQDNVKRLIQSSQILSMPAVEESMLLNMVSDIVRLYQAETPEPPHSMYIRPTHIGTEPAIGKAAHPSATSMLYVLLSPVGDYFENGISCLKILLEKEQMRCAPHMGMVKSGGNYASALKLIMDARASNQVDQILFCPDGDVQETGASNFVLIEGGELITKPLDSTFLHDITRDSVLTIARDLGLKVSERALSIDELLERSQRPEAEAALSGTAAVLTPVGTLVHKDQEYFINQNQEGKFTQSIRKTLNDIQWGLAEDKHQWMHSL